MVENTGPACTKEEQFVALARVNSDGANFCNEHIDLVRKFALNEYMETFAEPYDGQSEEDFDAFVLKAAAEFEKGFNHGFELEAQCVDILEELTEEKQTVVGILHDVIGLFKAIARLQRQADPSRRDLEIATLASVGAELGESARFILGGPTYSDRMNEEASVPTKESAPVVALPRHAEHADA